MLILPLFASQGFSLKSLYFNSQSVIVTHTHTNHFAIAKISRKFCFCFFFKSQLILISNHIQNRTEPVRIFTVEFQRQTKWTSFYVFARSRARHSYIWIKNYQNPKHIASNTNRKVVGLFFLFCWSCALFLIGIYHVALFICIQTPNVILFRLEHWQTHALTHSQFISAEWIP